MMSNVMSMLMARKLMTKSYKTDEEALPQDFEEPMLSLHALARVAKKSQAL